jgi:transcriptional regulator with XRE-family HTH domain
MKIARAARNRRLELGISQRQLAQRVGCDQSYLAQVETGRRPLSRAIAERLEVHLRVRTGRYTSVTFLRGRPRLSEPARHVLAQLRRATGDEPRPRLENWIPKKPRHPRSDRHFSLENQFWPMALHLGPSAGRQISELQSRRGADERFWRQINQIIFDSWSEKWVVAQVGLAATQLTGVSFSGVGCALESIHGRTGENTACCPYPAFLIQHRDSAVAWFPQRGVRTQRGFRWPDNVLVIARNGRKVTAVVEVAGPDYHQDREAEARRNAELGVPILHVSAAKVGTPELVTKILDWAHALVS